jgi:hypothetical protein
MMHHSTKPDGTTLTWPEVTLDHMGLVPTSSWLSQPMDYNGYHWGCELYETPYGGLYELLVGRPEWWVGGHCPDRGMNSKSLGVCLMGNLDETPPPEEQLIKVIRGVIVPKFYQYHWSVSELKNRVVGHGQITRDGRTCPGKLFPWDVFYALIREEMK